MARRTTKAKTGFSSKKKPVRRKQPKFTKKQLSSFVECYKQVKGLDSEE